MKVPVTTDFTRVGVTWVDNETSTLSPVPHFHRTLPFLPYFFPSLVLIIFMFLPTKSKFCLHVDGISSFKIWTFSEIFSRLDQRVSY